MTKEILIKNIKIGGGNKIAVQSMTNTSPLNTESTIKQILALEEAGCDIVRITVPTIEAADNLPAILKGIHIPLVADIHFDYRLAISAIKNGVHKIRFNPGNIGNEKNLKLLTDYAKDYGVPIRIGVNSGSIEKEFVNLDIPLWQKLVKSAQKHIALLESQSFYNIVVSVKASSVKHMVAAYEALTTLTDYPLHLGVTEAGTYDMAVVKSSVGIGSLLIKDIGDTIRVSITGDPVPEVKAAYNILKAVGKMPYIEIISCPTCGRCCYDLFSFAKEIENFTRNVNKSLKIAVMGCVVNGPGEAKDADIGIAGGDGKMIIFKKGAIVRTVESNIALAEFKKELAELIR